MYHGARGWLLVAGWWLFAICLAVFVPHVVVEQLPPAVRMTAWFVFASACGAGGLAFLVRVRRRLRNATEEFSAARRSQLRRNAQVGAGAGIFVAALLRGYDSPWALVVIGGVFLGGLPVVAIVSTYLLIRRGHTL